MRTVLIIDDEQPTRQAIRALVPWQDYRVGRILEASDGRQGLEALRSERPDIVFVDMRMPHIDGPEFLAAASRERPEAKYVVISGFDDFEYARQALKAGAVDYLLKPVRRRELQGVLEKVTAVLDGEEAERRRRLEEAMARNVSLPEWKAKWLEALMEYGGRFDGLVLPDMIGWSTDEPLTIAVSLIFNFDEVCDGRFGGDRRLCAFAIANALAELCSDGKPGFAFQSSRHSQQFWLVTAGCSGGGRTAKWEEALGFLGRTLGVDAFLAPADAARPLARLDESYREAKARLWSVNLIGAVPRVLAGKVSAIERDVFILEREEPVALAIGAGNAEAALAEVEAFFDRVASKGILTFEHQQATTAEFRLLFERLFARLRVEPGERSKQLEAFDRDFLGRTMRFTAYAESMRLRAEEVFRLLAGRTASDDGLDAALEAIRRHIETHYYEDLSVAHFAETHFVSREHLLRRFKQRFGRGIYEYVLHVRMEQAKRLLRDPRTDVRTVGELVGYADADYFRKAFKRQTGMSPAEYRKSLFDRQADNF